MLIEPSANHLSVFRPLVVGIEGGMNTDKSFAVVLDERHHVFLLAVIEVQFAGSAHEYQSIEVIEILGVSLQTLLGDEFGVSTQRGLPQTALATHVVDGDHARGNRVMLEALGLADQQNVLKVNLLFVRRRERGSSGTCLILGGCKRG